MELSSESIARAQATKDFLESRMAERKREMAAKRERRTEQAARLADPALSPGQRKTISSEFEAHERELSRGSRKRFSVNDFESRVVIGRGAFGEVRVWVGGSAVLPRQVV